MSYRIDYTGAAGIRKPLRSPKPRGALAAGIGVVTMVAGAIALRHTELRWVKRFLLPGDPALTAAALENAVESIRQGQGLSEAVAAFCREIVAHAG